MSEEQFSRYSTKDRIQLVNEKFKVMDRVNLNCFRMWDQNILDTKAKAKDNEQLKNKN